MNNSEKLLRSWREWHQSLWFHAESPYYFTCSWCFWGKRKFPGLLHLMVCFWVIYHHTQNHSSQGGETLLVLIWYLSVNTIITCGFVETCRGLTETQKRLSTFFFPLKICICKCLTNGRYCAEIGRVELWLVWQIKRIFHFFFKFPWMALICIISEAADKSKPHERGLFWNYWSRWPLEFCITLGVC